MKTKLLRLASGLLASLLLSLGFVRTAERLDSSAALPSDPDDYNSRVAATACTAACHFSGEIDRSELLAAMACTAACHYSDNASEGRLT